MGHDVSNNAIISINGSLLLGIKRRSERFPQVKNNSSCGIQRVNLLFSNAPNNYKNHRRFQFLRAPSNERIEFAPTLNIDTDRNQRATGSLNNIVTIKVIEQTLR